MLSHTLFSNPNEKLEKNRAFAKEIILAVAARFPHGGINIKANVVFYHTVEEFNDVVKKIEIFHAKNLPDFSTDFLDLKAGYCDELSSCGVQFSATSAPTFIVELVSLQYHVMNVVGRDPNSDPNNIDTWGNDAILFDAWSKTLIKADHFKTARTEGKIKKIPFYHNFADVNVNDDDDDTNYFDGEPCIDMYTTCQNYKITKKGIPQFLLNAYIQQIQTSYKKTNEPLPDINGCLRIAASRGALTTVCFLIEFAEADVNSTSPTNGRTAIYWAQAKNHKACEDYLKMRGACISSTPQIK